MYWFGVNPAQPRDSATAGPAACPPWHPDGVPVRPRAEEPIGFGNSASALNGEPVNTADPSPAFGNRTSPSITADTDPLRAAGICRRAPAVGDEAGLSSRDTASIGKSVRSTAAGADTSTNVPVGSIRPRSPCDASHRRTACLVCGDAPNRRSSCPTGRNCRYCDEEGSETALTKLASPADG